MANIIPPRRDEFLTRDGIPTRRFIEYLEALTQQTNETEVASSSTLSETALTQINALENRIGSGDFLTSDETGFTVDSTKLSVDMDEA